MLRACWNVGAGAGTGPPDATSVPGVARLRVVAPTAGVFWSGPCSTNGRIMASQLQLRLLSSYPYELGLKFCGNRPFTSW